MFHLGERVTEYVLGELTGDERAAAETHIRGCTECAEKVQEVRRTFSLLRSIPDVDPPQRIVFETEARYAAPRFWKWLVPATSAVAASLLTAIFLNFTGLSPSSPSATTLQPPVAVSAPVDVQAVVVQVKESCAQWLATEQNNTNREQNLEIQRVCSELAYWESQQRAASRESFDTARSLQLLVAQRLPSEN
jgi:anti-sigma factor RsiW